MPKCIKCSGERLVTIAAQCESFVLSQGKDHYSGVIPAGFGLGGSNDGMSLCFSFCLYCGAIQSPDFPTPREVALILTGYCSKCDQATALSWLVNKRCPSCHIKHLEKEGT